MPEPPQQARLATLAGLIAAHALSAGGESGLVHGGRTWSYADLDAAAVAMSAMVGAADPYEGEIPIMSVVTRPGKIVSEAELINLVAERITAYNIPARIHFQDHLSLTASGKIAHRDLRAPASAERPGSGRTTAGA